jgi:hypothetical protein
MPCLALSAGSAFGKFKTFIHPDDSHTFAGLFIAVHVVQILKLNTIIFAQGGISGGLQPLRVALYGTFIACKSALAG